MIQSYRSERRTNKVIQTLKQRQPSLQVVLENIHDNHNVSAIFRTCDAVGVPEVSLVYTLEKFPRIGKKSSASAFKWVEKKKYNSVKECYDKLHGEGYKIYASALREDAKSLYELPLNEKCAIVMGNEHRGVSDDAAELADEVFYIPMMGMVQSLNVSVATAVILYEALRQRVAKGMYSGSQFEETIIEQLAEEWLSK